MEDRFGLLFQIIDRAYVHRIRKERGFNVNPWATHNRFIISHNLIKDEEYAADLRTWLGRDLVRPRSLLILDEAHHAAPASGGRLCDHVAVHPAASRSSPPSSSTSSSSRPPPTTATPTASGRSWPSSTRSGSAAASRSRPGARPGPDLSAQGRPSRDRSVAGFPGGRSCRSRISAPGARARRSSSSPRKLEAYCSLREDRLACRTHEGPERLGIPQVGPPAAAPFLGRGLLAHAEQAHTTRSRTSSSRQPGGRPARMPIWTSEPWRPSAAGSTPTRRAKTTWIHPTDPDRASRSPTMRDGRGGSPDRDGDPGHARRHPIIPSFAREMTLLAEMLDAGRTGPAPARREAEEALRVHRAEHARGMREGTRSATSWNGHRIIIFTEYDDTLAYVRRHLEAHHPGDRPRRTAGWPSTGARPRSKNGQEIKEAFNADPADHPGPDPARDRRGPRGPEPPEVLLRTCSTTTSPGTRPGWSSATAGSTANSSPRPSSIAATSSTRTGRRTRSSAGSSRRPRRSIASWAGSAPSSTRG